MSATSAARLAIGAGTVVFALIVAAVAVAIATLLGTAIGGDAGRSLGFDGYVARVTRFTLWQAALSTLLSVGLAIPVARALVRRPRFFGRTWLIRLFALPLGLPAIVVALGLIAIWGRQGLFNDALAIVGAETTLSIYGLTGILIAHVFFNMPLAVRLLIGALERVPAEHWRNAAQLGLGPATLFRIIEWPAIARVLPGIISLVFMLCATSFTLVLLLGGGPGATTIEVAIYQALRFDFDPPRAVFLALIQIGLTGIVLGLLAFLPRAEESTTMGGAARRFDGADMAARAIDAGLLALAGTFVAMPLVAIVLSGMAADLTDLLREAVVIRAVLTSLAVAAAAALLAVAAGYVLVSARHAALRRGRAHGLAAGYRAALGGSSSFILLVPPIVLGAGWFLAVRGRVDLAVATPIIVVAINALMALPFAVRILEGAHTTHAARSDRLCAALGISGLTRVRRIDWPVMKRPIATAGAFSMALSLGDLGAIALFGSRDLVTLPYLLLERMGSYRTEDAAGLALVLTVLCLALMIVGTPGKRADRQEAAAL